VHSELVDFTWIKAASQGCQSSFKFSVVGGRRRRGENRVFKGARRTRSPEEGVPKRSAMFPTHREAARRGRNAAGAAREREREGEGEGEGEAEAGEGGENCEPHAPRETQHQTQHGERNRSRPSHISSAALQPPPRRPSARARARILYIRHHSQPAQW
jgi:hypothetical protein